MNRYEAYVSYCIKFIAVFFLTCFANSALAKVLSLKYDLSLPEKPIVVIIPSYNNEKWVEQNLTSVFTQKYKNYRVIYVDDCSTDSTFQQVRQIVEKFDAKDRTTLIHNDENRGAMANWYTAIHSCADDEIVVQLDGDDWLAYEYVLAYINFIYSNKDIWMTYGQFKEYPSGVIGYDYSRPFSDEVITSNLFRNIGQLPISHLRTFYAWLFKNIKLEDTLYEDYFYTMTCDKLMMACLIELAGRHHYCVPDVLYIYNNHNPLSDHRLNIEFQHKLAWHILSQKPYRPLPVQNSIEHFDTYDHVALVYLCESNYEMEVTKRIIEDMGPVHEKYIVTQENGLCIGVDAKVITYQTHELKKNLYDLLRGLESNYVLLVTAAVEAIHKIDFCECIKLLKKTCTSIFYCDFASANHVKQLLLNKRLPRVTNEWPVFGWYSHNRNGNWELPVLKQTIFNRFSLLEALQDNDFASIHELQSVLENWVVKNDKIGLVYVEN